MIDSIDCLLGGRYRILDVLRSHQLGQTYLASDLHSLQPQSCVIEQVLLPNHQPRTIQFSLLLLEKKAQVWQLLAHHDQIPNLWHSFSAAESFFLVEEFIAGHPLSQELRPYQPWSERQVMELLQAVLPVLQCVHHQGMIHQGIAPTHLIRRHRDQQLVLTGCGTTMREMSIQLLGLPHPDTKRPAAEVIYKAPEQIQGQPRFNSDLYALGMIGIQALTGLPPVSLASSIPGMGCENRAIPSSLGTILDRMVYPDPDRRYQTAEEVLADIQHCQPHPMSALPSAHSTTDVVPSPKPSTHPLALVGGVALMLISGIFLALYHRLPEAVAVWYVTQQQGIPTPAPKLSSDHNYLQEALLQQKGGDAPAALVSLTKAIQRNPNAVEAYYQRGNLRLSLGDSHGAIQDYNRVIQLVPNRVEAYVNRGSALAALGEEQQAIEDYTRALQQNPQLAAAYLNRCLSQTNLGHYQAALTDCEQAISLQPANSLAYQNRGLVYRRLNQVQAALDDYNIAIRLSPGDPDPYYNRGLVRHDLGDMPGAIADYTQAIQRDPNHVLAYYDRGIAYAGRRQESLAKADFEKAATLCLNVGRLACYKDAQYQIQKLSSSGLSTTSLQIVDSE